MMNSNPETVSTDYDTSSRLYFEPLTVEDVLNVIDVERPDGIIVQFGGQTPLKLARPLQEALSLNPIPTASGASLCLLLLPLSQSAQSQFVALDLACLDLCDGVCCGPSSHLPPTFLLPASPSRFSLPTTLPFPRPFLAQIVLQLLTPFRCGCPICAACSEQHC